jgi:hypothetical protein
MRLRLHNTAWVITIPGVGGQVLAETKEEKEIGVTVTSNLKPLAQCAKWAKTVLGQIGRAFHYGDRDSFVRLFQQYVRPDLEFCTNAWSPWMSADRLPRRGTSEGSYQHRATEIVRTRSTGREMPSGRHAHRCTR